MRLLRSWLSRARAHDTAHDQIDDALEANAAGRRALVLSLVALLVLSLIHI